MSIALATKGIICVVGGTSTPTPTCVPDIIIRGFGGGEIITRGFGECEAEGAIVYVPVCAPDMDAEWQRGEMFVRARKYGMLAVGAQLERLIPVVGGDVERLVPVVGGDVEDLKPEMHTKVCDYEE